MRPWMILGWLLLSLGCAAQGPTGKSDPAPKKAPAPVEDTTEEDGPPLPPVVERPALLPRMRGVDVGVIAAAFSPDGRYIVSVNGDGTLTLWDATRDQDPLQPGGGPLQFKGIREYSSQYWSATPPTGLLFSPDGKYILCARGGEVWRWGRDSGRGRLLFKYLGPPWAEREQPRQYGRWLVVQGRGGGAEVWDLLAGRCVARLASGDRGCAAAVSPDGKHALLVNRRGEAEEWDLASGQRLRLLNPRPSGWFLEQSEEPFMHCIVYAPGGRRAVSAQEGSRLLRVWDLDSGRVLKTIDLGEDVKEPDALAVSPDGKRLACRVSAKGVKVCDPEKGLVLHAVNDYDADSFVLVFSPDNKYLLLAGYCNRAPLPATYTEDRVLLLWEVEKQKLARTIAYPR